MSRPVLFQLMNKVGKGSSGGKGDNKNKKKEWRERKAKLRPPGITEQLNPLKANEWVIEKQERKNLVKDQYFKDKRRLYVSERHASAKLKAQLKSRKNEIDVHYKVRKLKENDPRLEKARRMARRAFERYERKIERKHRAQWQKQYQGLRSQRDKQYHSISKAMKREYRKDRGKPTESQAPWKI